MAIRGHLSPSDSFAYILNTSPHCLRLFWQLARRAASRARASDGRRMAAKMEMMPITTSNSIKVNPSPSFVRSGGIESGVRELLGSAVVASEAIFFMVSSSPVVFARSERAIGRTSATRHPYTKESNSCAKHDGTVKQETTVRMRNLFPLPVSPVRKSCAHLDRSLATALLQASWGGVLPNPYHVLHYVNSWGANCSHTPTTFPNRNCC